MFPSPREFGSDVSEPSTLPKMTQAPIGWIFDMDGTLADNMIYHARAWIALFEDQDLEVSMEAFMPTAGMKSPEVVRHFMGDLSDDIVNELCGQKDVLYRFLYRHRIRPMPGLLKLLAAARRQGVRLAVATASGPRGLAMMREGLRLDDRFDAIAGGAEVARGKPFPDVFLLAGERLGVPPARCIVFEDAELGVEAAARAGMPVIGVASTGVDPDRLAALPAVRRVITDFRGLTVADVNQFLPH